MMSVEKGESNSNLKITVTIRAALKPGSVKAHADVRVEFFSSTFEIFGVSIIQHDPAKPAWVSYPQRAGKDAKKYFAIVKLSGVLHEKVCATVLQQWERASASDHAGAVPRAQMIPHQPGEDEIPF